MKVTTTKEFILRWQNRVMHIEDMGAIIDDLISILETLEQKK